MTVARVIARSVADVVEQFELDGDVVVTIERLGSVMRQIGVGDDPRRLAYELQRSGWFGQLRTRHAWEFLPGARGGAYGSGDRFIEFRAQRAIRSEWPGVLAMESAASVLGLAQRIPEQEVMALPDDAVFPKALGGEWRRVHVELVDATARGRCREDHRVAGADEGGSAAAHRLLAEGRWRFRGCAASRGRLFPEKHSVVRTTATGRALRLANERERYRPP
ncbi:hypothetical protein SAMN02745244_00650 [Tessaracoccus bendigoensis DSM 12906]|uniref:Uncharacterized protein n=1 Tax=Tessaracoccus bendigoensis DSM 12906 TaxID=1123357 RepID=A0A1M6CBP5_9ACTN|nr:hypothetical protein [Tessaracoccus bendigoensis]SHI58455.1 hypothetical protein SAMN02745244_00650 [Tessaracoccus bendigoensis DSM 12906]